MFEWLNQLDKAEEIIIIVGILAIVWSIFFGAAWLKKKTKIHSIGKNGIEFDYNSESLIMSLEVRDYKHQLQVAFDLIKDEIRYRVRKNRWLERNDWPEYKAEAIKQFHISLTKSLDDYYHPDSKIERLELYEWNQLLHIEIDNLFNVMFERMLDAVRRGYDVVKIKRSEVDNIIQNRECIQGLKECPNIYRVIRLTTEIVIDENLNIREQCMIEAERGIAEIIQRYYSHYLKKFKEKSEE